MKNNQPPIENLSLPGFVSTAETLLADQLGADTARTHTSKPHTGKESGSELIPFDSFCNEKGLAGDNLTYFFHYVRGIRRGHLKQDTPIFRVSLEYAYNSFLEIMEETTPEKEDIFYGASLPEE